MATKKAAKKILKGQAAKAAKSGAKIVRMSVRIPGTLVAALNPMAEKHGVPFGTVLTLAARQAKHSDLEHAVKAYAAAVKGEVP